MECVPRGNLAFLFQAQGELDTARPLYERALAIRERVLGPGYPAMIRSRQQLDQVHVDLPSAE